MKRPAFEKLYIYVFTIIAGFVVADLIITSYRAEMLPKEAPPKKKREPLAAPKISRSEYQVIAHRNILNSDGVVPQTLAGKNASKKSTVPRDDGRVTRSKLPLKLLGTIVHGNPSKSVATISLTSKSIANAYKVDEQIEKMARVTLIERKKVTFRNLSSNRMEFIDIPEDLKVNFGVQVKKAAHDGVVVNKGQFNFVLKRSDLEKYTNDLTSILSQARMIPNISPGGGGAIDGFKFASINTGSIYENLGFKKNDVIKEVNGEPIDSVTKAMELYQALKASNGLSVTVERDGRTEAFEYTIE